MSQIIEFRCSKLDRVMKCAGFAFMKDLPESETNQAAKEGTACGEYLEHMLLKKNPPSVASNGIHIDDDMRFYTQPLIDELSNLEVLCEQRIDWQTESGIWIRGQYDASYVKDGKLYIDDLKYGWKHVEIKENWQLLGYAIGEIIRRGKTFDRVVMRIYQPRPHHEDGNLREWEVDYDQLCDYKNQIERRMQQIKDGYAQLCTGPQCKYCPAAASACTAFNKSVFHGIDYVLDHFQQDDINEKEISFQLDLLNRITDVMKIKQDSLNQLAINRISQGAIIPNYMTEHNYGDRKWKSDVSPSVIEVLTGKKIVKETMLSPAQAEKAGVPKELVKQYVDRHFIGMKLVRKDASELGNKIFGKPKGE